MDITEFGSQTRRVLFGFNGVTVAQAMWDYYGFISLLPQTEMSKL